MYCDESALKALSQDALLADTKIITVYWNGKTGTKKHMANYNNDFQNIVRRLLKGDENMLGEFAAISRKNEANSASINYIANNNGFTLNDLVSYDRKHNELNGENNRDGEDFNFSWNCGEEGSTRKRKIKELRMRQIKMHWYLFSCRQVLRLYLPETSLAIHRTVTIIRIVLTVNFHGLTGRKLKREKKFLNGQRLLYSSDRIIRYFICRSRLL